MRYKNYEELKAAAYLDKKILNTLKKQDQKM
jgi:hypothetical protein